MEKHVYHYYGALIQSKEPISEDVVANIPQVFQNDNINIPEEPLTEEDETPMFSINVEDPGGPVIMSTFDQLTTTGDKQDDDPNNIFITTPATFVKENDDNDDDSAPEAEPASDRIDVPASEEPNIADLVDLKDTEKYFFGFTEPQV